MVTVGRPDDKQNRCRTEEECECEELHLRRGFPLVYWVMYFVSSSFFWLFGRSCLFKNSFLLLLLVYKVLLV